MQISTKNKRIAIILSSAILAISVVVLILSLVVANRLQRKVAEQQLTAYLDKVELETEAEFNNLFLTLNIVRDWAKSESLKNLTLKELNSKLIPIIANTPQVSAVSVVASTGETYNIRHEAPNYESYYSKNDTLEKADMVVFTPDEDHLVLEDTLVMHKVTSLPSYKKHLLVEYDSIIRYPLQLIPGNSTLSGTAFTIKTKDSSGTDYVITVYKSLYRLYLFLNSIKVTESSQVFLFTPDGRYFDYKEFLDGNLNSVTVDGYLLDLEHISDSNLYAAYSEWLKLDKVDSISFVDYKHKGEDYMAVLKPNRDSINGIWTALVIPQADFALVLKGKLGLVFAVSIFLLVFSLVVMFFFIRQASKTERINMLDDIELEQLIKQGENDFVEFKSTIRLNLHSNKMGKEIELAWLKSVVAFCNTEGGRILIGVKDNGEIFGLESDRFPNDDKTLLHIQNLIKQHVGLEFAKYIHYSLREIDDKKILVIRCQPISAPMFLKFNDKEQFFVRSGPASIELPVSKALKYIKERGK